MTGKRAPDNQPTSSIRHMLNNAESAMLYWQLSKNSAERALANAESALAFQQRESDDLRAWLEVREQEEQARELTGL